MLLAGLALLPTIVLVAWIYRQDKVEKEPKGLLWKIFLFGVLSVIPAMILEIIFEEILLVFVEGYTLYYVICLLYTSTVISGNRRAGKGTD